MINTFALGLSVLAGLIAICRAISKRHEEDQSVVTLLCWVSAIAAASIWSN